MTETEYVCRDCGSEPTQMNNYCGQCGAGPDPWKEEECYDFQRDVDLPHIFSFHQYDDGYGLWRAFCESAFGTHGLRGKDIANLPEGMPRMKYQETELFFKLDESYELHGPFLDRQDARDA